MEPSSSGSDEVRLVNGVFKGGGAKGIAYAGALKALRARGLWFGSVAGASAGAITATLIAAGLDPDQLAAQVPDALDAAKASIPQRLAMACAGQVTSIFDSAKLRRWLDDTLRTCVGGDRSVPVTFAELFAHRGIELYVVVLDLATQQPVVFCRRTTPHVEVAGAVTASSAIPGAFPPGRGVFDCDGAGAVVHQFVDGGAWANYPAFVFQDRSFRAWLRHEATRVPRGDAGGHAGSGGAAADEAAWAAEEARPMIGFVLGERVASQERSLVGMMPAKGARVSHRFDLGPTFTSRRPVEFAIGSVLSTNVVRAVVGLALAVWVVMSVAALPWGLRRVSTWLDAVMDGPLDTLYPIALVGLCTVLVLAVVTVTVTVLVLLLVSRLIADTLLPSMQAIMGVPTGVPPWLGLGPEAVVLHVPHGDVRTTQFRLSAPVRSDVVARAERSVAVQLDQPEMRARFEALFAGDPMSFDWSLPPAVPAGSGRDAAGAAPDRASVIGFVAAAGAALVVAVLGWWAIQVAASAGIWRTALLVAAAVIVVGASVGYVGVRTGARASGRARYGVDTSTRQSRWLSWAAAAVGVGAVVAGLAVSAVAMDERAEVVSSGRVIAAELAAGQNRYRIERDAGVVELVTARHLRLGERVNVRDRAGSFALVGPLDDGRFAAAVALVVLGLGLVTSALRRRAWVSRCARLAGLVARWRETADPHASRPAKAA